MGSYSLTIEDFNERPCDKKGCKNLANQYKITVVRSRAKVQKYCNIHKVWDEE